MDVRTFMLLSGGGSAVARPGRPLVGQLRVIGKSYGDDTGPRRVLFCSWFPALRIWRDDREAATAQLDRIAAAGWQGIRVFTAVGALPFWAGREVLPLAWGDYDDVFTSFVLACKARGLRLALTTGDNQVVLPSRDAKIQHAQRIGRLVVEADCVETIALFEVCNERWQNGYDDDDVAFLLQVAQWFRSSCPGPLIALGAAAGDAEEPANLERAAGGGDIVVVHGNRERDNAARRAFNLGYEADFRLPIWQGEPTGPDGSSREVYMPNSPEVCFAVYAAQQITGQATVFFNGPAVRYREPLDVTWGFTELPAIFAALPEDIGQWPHVSHGNKGSTPIGAQEFADSGRGPARVDMAWSDTHIACIVHGGVGEWRLIQRRAMHWRACAHTGLVAEGSGVFPSEWNASLGSLLLVGEFS